MFLEKKMSAAAILLAVVIAQPASSQDDFPFLRREAIREAYESARKGWSETPRMVLDAFVASEDVHFRDKPASRSTITRHLQYWYPEPGAGRQTFALTIALAQALTRDEILDWYVNGVFLGQGCFGVDDAAQAYFGKNTERLGLHEVALLAALPRAPANLHPVRHHDRALERRNFVLRQMVEGGFVTQGDAASASLAPMMVRNPPGVCPPRKGD